jgi:Flp pilus assembly protein TadB
MLRKAGAVILLMAFMALGSTLPAQARDRDDKCEQRIHKAEENLRKAERKHGPNSRQVQKRRHELEEAREHCRHVGDRDHDHDHR